MAEIDRVKSERKGLLVSVLVTLLVVFMIRNTSLRFLVPYVDPLLVLIVGGIAIGIPIRMSWNALLEMLNRTPSPGLLTEVRGIVEASLSDLPVKDLAVRVIQPGRTRIIAGHVLLAPGCPQTVHEFDRVRAKADAALKAEYPLSALDLVFTCDARWSAPLVKTD